MQMKLFRLFLLQVYELKKSLTFYLSCLNIIDGSGLETSLLNLFFGVPTAKQACSK